MFAVLFVYRLRGSYPLFSTFDLIKRKVLKQGRQTASGDYCWVLGLYGWPLLMERSETKVARLFLDASNRIKRCGGIKDNEVGGLKLSLCSSRFLVSKLEVVLRLWSHWCCGSSSFELMISMKRSPARHDAGVTASSLANFNMIQASHMQTDICFMVQIII